jgi:hypothetical protein
VLYALKNMAVAAGKQIDQGISNMLQSVLGSGLIQAPKDVAGRDNQTRNREGLGLPPAPAVEDPQKFMQVLMKAATETLG